MKLLLDTCTFLWLALSHERLSAAATKAINDPATELFFSDVSIWEIVLKNTAGKLPLPDTPRSWIPSRLAFFHIQSAPLDHEAIFTSGELPLVHADPFDRLLAAQAISDRLVLLTPDVQLKSLGAATLW